MARRPAPQLRRPGTIGRCEVGGVPGLHRRSAGCAASPTMTVTHTDIQHDARGGAATLIRGCAPATRDHPTQPHEPHPRGRANNCLARPHARTHNNVGATTRLAGVHTISATRRVAIELPGKHGPGAWRGLAEQPRAPHISWGSAAGSQCASCVGLAAQRVGPNRMQDIMRATSVSSEAMSRLGSTASPKSGWG